MDLNPSLSSPGSFELHSAERKKVVNAEVEKKAQKVTSRKYSLDRILSFDFHSFKVVVVVVAVAAVVVAAVVVVAVAVRVEVESQLGLKFGEGFVLEVE